jgi:hypothetical protein
MTTDHVPTPQALGFRNAAWMAVFVLPPLFFLAAALEGLPGLGLQAAAEYVVVGAMALGMVLGAFVLATQYRARGGLIQDCGPHPIRWFFLGFGGFSLLMGHILIAGSQVFGSGASINHIGVLFMGVFALALAFGRLQVVTNGIWGFWGLKRWDQMAGYRWGPKGMLLLEARRGFPFPWVRTGGILVPEAQRETVEHALRRNGVAELGEAAP